MNTPNSQFNTQGDNTDLNQLETDFIKMTTDEIVESFKSNHLDIKSLNEREEDKVKSQILAAIVETFGRNVSRDKAFALIEEIWRKVMQRNAPETSQEVVLDQMEKAFVHDLAIDMAERFRADGMDYAFNNVNYGQQRGQNKGPMQYFIRQTIAFQFGDNYDPQKIELMTRAIIERVDEIEKLEQRQIAAQSQVDKANATSINRDRFVRLIPRTSYINDGFWKKLKRSWNLSGGNAYNLKTAEKNPGHGYKYNANVFGKQSDLKYGENQKVVLSEMVHRLSSDIEGQRQIIGGNEKIIDQIKADLKSVEKGIKDTYEWVDEFETALKIEQMEEEENGPNNPDILSKIWGRRTDQKYADAYNLQAEVEAEIIAVEKKLKTFLGFTPATSPVAENANAMSSYNAATTSLKDFQDRQTRISARMGEIAAFADNAIHKVETTLRDTRNKIEEHEKHQGDYKKQLKEIGKAEKQWLKLEPAELERLFWYNFGSKVTQIKDWQKQLPMVSRMGQVPFRAQTTAISREYAKLREMIMKFEDEQRITGLMAVMDSELGTIRINESLTNPRLEEARKNLAEVQKELLIRKTRLLTGMDNAEESGNAPASNPSIPPLSPARVSTPAQRNASANVPPAPTAPSQNPPSTVNAQGAGQPTTPPANTVTVTPNEQPNIAVDGPVAPQPEAATQVTIDPQPQAQVASIGAVTPATEAATTVTPNINTPAQVQIIGAIAPATEVASEVAPVTQTSAQISAKGAVEPEEAPVSEEAITIDEKARQRLDVKDANPSVETFRSTETLIIGDLNGSYEAFNNARLALKVVDDHGNWIAGDRKLVEIGDILFDRIPEGLLILRENMAMREKAKAYNGSIEVIYGNHEDMTVSFLTERAVGGTGDTHDNHNAISNAMNPRRETDGTIRFTWQGFGMLEFISRFSEYGTKFNGDLAALKKDMEEKYKAQGAGEFSKLPAEVLLKMQNTANGVKILEEICLMKLVTLDNDTIFFHTEPTEKILAELTEGEDAKKTVARINSDFQNNLRALLFKSGKFTSEFTRLTSIFVHPDNREFEAKSKTDSIKEKLSKLAKAGIKRIVHGHSTVELKNAVNKIEGMDVVNVDLGAGRPDTTDPNILSIAVLDRTSKVALGKGEASKIEAYDGNRSAVISAVDDWLDGIFGSDKPEFSDLADNLVKVAKLDSKETAQQKLPQELQEFLVEMGNLQLKNSADKVLQPKIGDLVEMINFYNEWVAIDKRPLAEKVSAIKAFDLNSPKAIFDQWRDSKKAKETAKSAPIDPAAIVEDTAKAAAEITPEPETVREAKVAKAVDAEETMPLTVKPLNQMSEAELKESFLRQLPQLLGLNGNESKLNAILDFLEKVEISSPKKFNAIAKNALLHPKAVEFLFTAGVIASKLKLVKVKPISSGEIKIDIDDTNLIKVLNKPTSLAKVEAYLNSTEDAKVIAEMKRAKNLSQWFSQL